ncbi:MAG: hypothetical protein ACJ741_00615 [Pyrinomonadaceae bacterium]
MFKKLRTLKRRTPPAWLRECLNLLGFFALTSLMTWPWVTRMRDAVADPGDPYAIAWVLWWDFHQTFHAPLQLFHANVFYPDKYTLAFSEHDYGIALLCFPLFAIGLRALTVHSVATFAAFAFSGYGAFRLARTTTDSVGAAWLAGIVFAFIPYRFHLLSHLHYMFAGWMPLLVEALVFFARARTRRRAAWLGISFLMNGLTCITWLVMTTVPLALTAAYLVARYRLQRDRAFWSRGAVAIVAASLLLMPFMLPYQKVTKLYGFKFPDDDAIKHSASAADWLAVERRNRVWSGLGDTLPGVQYKLFPGLTPLLLALAALITATAAAGESRRALEDEEEARAEERRTGERGRDKPPHRLLFALDALAIIAGSVALVGAGYAGAHSTVVGIEVVGAGVSDDALLLLVVALCVRWCVAYPQLLMRGDGANLIETLRATRRPDAFWIGLAWAFAGFLGSFGMKFFLYRELYESLLPFRSLRIPARAAMLCYVGLALLAAVGATHLARALSIRSAKLKPAFVYAALAALLLFELHGSPLEFTRGAVFPDEVTLRLKRTEMRGGVVELPSSQSELNNHLYMLRAADHGRPLVNATSSFISEETWQIFQLTKGPGVDPKLLDLFEQVPVSYVVVRHRWIKDDRRDDFARFLAQAEASGRLRLIHTYPDGNALYAVTRTEPEATPDDAQPPTQSSP